MAIHPTAVVADSAELGPDVNIGPYCVVGPAVRLGARTTLRSHVIVEGDTWLGEDCEVFPFACLGTTPQDKKLKGDQRPGRLRIGDRNRIREHATVHGGTSFGGGLTTVGDDNMLLVGCHIGHDASVGSRVVFTNGAMAAGHTEIGDGAILGAMTGIHQFARIGELAMIGAGAMVSNDAPPFSMVQGDRARMVGVNTVGLHRSGYSAEQKALIKRVFRLLFWRAGTIHNKLEMLRNSPFAEHAECRKILDFVAASRRGVCTPRNVRLQDPKGIDVALPESLVPATQRNGGHDGPADRGRGTGSGSGTGSGTGTGSGAATRGHGGGDRETEHGSEA